MGIQSNIKYDRNISGMTKLTPSSKSTWYLIGIAFGALLWNCLYIQYFKSVIDSFDRESAIIFMGLFIAVNIVLFIAFCYYLVFYHIRRPMLKISNRNPRPGEIVAVTWELPDYHSITRFRLTMEGLESMGNIENMEDTEYASRKNQEIRSVFLSIILADTMEKHDIKSGAAEFKIPGDAMHSFDDGRFQIVWQLKLYAAKKWKDRRIKYTINVQPYAV